MDDTTTGRFTDTLQAIVADFVPIMRRFAVGRYAIAVGGSTGKGMTDAHSDVDFRFYHEHELPGKDAAPGVWAELEAAIGAWRARGTEVDGIWPRQISAIEAALARWLSGELVPDDFDWAVWGYHLLPDLYHQATIEDPYGIIAGWKQRLAHYPSQLQQAVLRKHWGALRYWRSDYHYASKVRRGDVVFLASLSAKLVHHLMQVLFALNESYYVGDGQNIEFAEQFRYKPLALSARVAAALYPPPAPSMFEQQRDTLLGLIADTERLLAQAGTVV